MFRGKPSGPGVFFIERLLIFRYNFLNIYKTLWIQISTCLFLKVFFKKFDYSIKNFTFIVVELFMITSYDLFIVCFDISLFILNISNLGPCSNMLTSLGRGSILSVLSKHQLPLC